MARGWRGVFTIPVTPFDERGELDRESLKREVDWCVRAGAHGIVAPVNASEGPSLTDEERREVTKIVVETTAGRIPTVIGVSATGVQSSLQFTRWARELGADAVMAMPPYGARITDFDAIIVIDTPPQGANPRTARGSPTSTRSSASIGRSARRRATCG